MHARTAFKITARRSAGGAVGEPRTYQYSSRAERYVFRELLTRRLTSKSGARKNRAAMITAIRKPLDTCAATGCYSPSWSHSLLGQLEPRVTAIEF
jgi:hypothetical protein